MFSNLLKEIFVLIQKLVFSIFVMTVDELFSSNCSIQINYINISFISVYIKVNLYTVGKTKQPIQEFISYVLFYK